MSKNSLKLQLTGIEELLSQIQKMGGNVNQAAEQAMIASAHPFHQDLVKAIKKHRRSGVTESSLKSPTQVKWQGNQCTIEVGFNIKKGGLPALFLEYGTPHMKARPFIRPAINRNKRHAKIIQQQTIEKLLKDLSL